MEDTGLTAQPTIYIVDDDASVCTGLLRLLRTAGHRTAAFGSAEAFLQQVRPDDPGCLVLDLQMPGVSGLDLQERLDRLGYSLPIVFLTAHGGVPESVRAIKRGAVNFLTKPVDEETLFAAIDEALRGLRERLAKAAEKSTIRRQMDKLSVREFETMQCVISGALNKQIAAQLGIAEKTVKIHRGRVMQKLGVSSVAELVRVCATAGVGQMPVGQVGEEFTSAPRARD